MRPARAKLSVPPLLRASFTRVGSPPAQLAPHDMRSLAPLGGIATRGGAPATCFAGCNRPVACRAAAVACRAASTALPRQACRVAPLFAARRPSAAAARAAARRAARGERGSPVAPRADIGGEYIENYDDVDRMMLNYFTYKARALASQLAQRASVRAFRRSLSRRVLPRRRCA